MSKRSGFKSQMRFMLAFAVKIRRILKIGEESCITTDGRKSASLLPPCFFARRLQAAPVAKQTAALEDASAHVNETLWPLSCGYDSDREKIGDIHSNETRIEALVSLSTQVGERGLFESLGVRGAARCG